MAAILQMTTLNAFLLNENISILNIISLKYVSEGPIDDMSALVQAIAWLPFSTKPLPESMLTNIYAIIWHCYIPMS